MVKCIIEMVSVVIKLLFESEAAAKRAYGAAMSRKENVLETLVPSNPTIINNLIKSSKEKDCKRYPGLYAPTDTLKILSNPSNKLLLWGCEKFDSPAVSLQERIIVISGLTQTPPDRVPWGASYMPTAEAALCVWKGENFAGISLAARGRFRLMFEVNTDKILDEGKNDKNTRTAIRAINAFNNTYLRHFGKDVSSFIGTNSWIITENGEDTNLIHASSAPLSHSNTNMTKLVVKSPKGLFARTFPHSCRRIFVDQYLLRDFQLLLSGAN